MNSTVCNLIVAAVIIIPICVGVAYIDFDDEKTEVYIGEDARSIIERYYKEVPPSAKDLYIFNKLFLLDRFSYIGMTVPLDELKIYFPKMVKHTVPYEYSYENFAQGFPTHWKDKVDDIGPQKYSWTHRTTLWDLKSMEDPVSFWLSDIQVFVFDRKTERLLIYEIQI